MLEEMDEKLITQDEDGYRALSTASLRIMGKPSTKIVGKALVPATRLIRGPFDTLEDLRTRIESRGGSVTLDGHSAP